MKVVEIPKKGGGCRRIYIAPLWKRVELRRFLPRLQAMAMALDVHDVMHGFVPGRSPVTNAMQHIGFKYTLSMDLQDFFDHVTVEKIENLLDVHTVDSLVSLLHPDSQRSSKAVVALQGLCTSPSLANIAFSPIDDMIVRHIAMGARYTRYADDMTFSSNDHDQLLEIKRRVENVCEQQGFPVAKQKTRFQTAACGRRIITGIGVDDKGIHPTRKAKRKLRAARHQRKNWQAKGLEEWCKLKEPDKLKLIMRLKTEYDRLSSYDSAAVNSYRFMIQRLAER